MIVILDTDRETEALRTWQGLSLQGAVQPAGRPSQPRSAVPILGEGSAPALPASFYTFPLKGSNTGAFSWLWSQREVGPSKLSCYVITAK